MTLMIPNYTLVMYAGVVRLPDLFSDSSRLALDGCHGAGRNKQILEPKIQGESPYYERNFQCLAVAFGSFDPKY